MFLTRFLTSLNVRHKLALLVGLVVISFACLFYTALEEIAAVREAIPLYHHVLRQAEHIQTLSSLRLTLAEILTILTEARYATDADRLQTLQRQAHELSDRVNLQFRKPMPPPRVDTGAQGWDWRSAISLWSSWVGVLG